MPYLRDCDPLTGEVIRASKTTAVRYETAVPGDLVHMDVKKIGRIPDGGGWQGRGELISNHQSRPDKRTKIGFDYVHALVDDHSRLAYAEILPDEKGSTCAAFLLRAAAYFATHGITIRQVMTDNHLSYKRSNDVRDAIATIGAQHIFIKAHCPWQNGKVERFNRTLQTEWAYRQVVHQQRRAHRSPCPLARPLQHSTTPLSHRRPATDQPTVMNVSAEYS